jgi:GDP-4-dehydro-6-deoxy-D-mannose reductase
VTGASGFVAPYLTLELEKGGHQVVLTSRSKYKVKIGGRERDAYVCDLTSADDIVTMLKELKPDAVVHLAGAASVGRSWTDRTGAIEGNLVTTQQICRALHDLKRPTTFLYTSSALVFAVADNERHAFTEDDPVNPNIPYGMSKLAAEYVVNTYRADHLNTYIVRPFNHIGPGQSSEFVCAALAERIAAAHDGDEIRVGNVSSSRDFSDVRDIVRAYRLILEKKPASPLFVLGSGKTVTIKWILDSLIALSGKKLRVTHDQALERPSDPKAVMSNPRLALEELGWHCEIPLEQTLKEIYQDALNRSLT